MKITKKADNIVVEIEDGLKNVSVSFSGDFEIVVEDTRFSIDETTIPDEETSYPDYAIHRRG